MESCTFEKMKDYMYIEEYTGVDIQADHLQDCYTLMYGILGRVLLDECKTDGDAALREATRRYGRDRGIRDRNNHLEAGCRVNMYSVFNIGGGLPGNKRTSSLRFRSSPQQHVSQVLVCPMADIWDEYGVLDIGRIYCEEFHYAYYNSYGFGKTKVYLGSTLTERDSEYCSFNVILRPSDLTEEEKKLCFDEYDAVNRKPDLSRFVPQNAQEGYRFLYLRLYYYILECASQIPGGAGTDAVIKGLNILAGDMWEYLKKHAENDGLPLDENYAALNYPVCLHTGEEPNWKEYGKYRAREIMQEEFCDKILEKLKLQ